MIVDTANYYPDVRDRRIAEIDAEIRKACGHRSSYAHFKAFNSIMFHA